jgi:signal transduction histidine kinase
LEATRLRISGLIQDLESQVTNRTSELESALNGLQKAQNSLVESQKLAALGGLVAGVAHDLNTPIGNARMAVSTASHYAQLLRSTLDPSNKSKRSDIERLCLLVEESCELAEANAIRSAELISSFMCLSVDRASERRRHFDLKNTILDTLAATMPSLRPAGIEIIDIALTSRIDMDSYPGTLAQILGNLWDNARIHGLSNNNHGINIILKSPNVSQLFIRYVSSYGLRKSTPTAAV